jgi:hypothetical protein
MLKERQGRVGVTKEIVCLVSEKAKKKSAGADKKSEHTLVSLPRLCTNSPRNQATRYPKTMASLVSMSSCGEGMPAMFQRSPFHSLARWKDEPTSKRRTVGPPSVSQRP